MEGAGPGFGFGRQLDRCLGTSDVYRETRMGTMVGRNHSLGQNLQPHLFVCVATEEVLLYPRKIYMASRGDGAPSRAVMFRPVEEDRFKLIFICLHVLAGSFRRHRRHNAPLYESRKGG